MAVDVPVLREVVQRVFTRNDVLNACKRRDIGAVIEALCAQGVTQGQISVLTGIPQGRLSEYKTHKRSPTATSTFQAFADGLAMPPAAPVRSASTLRHPNPARSVLSGGSQPRSPPRAWETCSPCSARCHVPARSRCCLGSARSTGATSRRTG